ncbi:MAG: hypothetical protein LIP77_01925 [Planctomycetes bacterium]|nr:hypothetical protein [Planctomycetota bacterium]
MTERQTDAMVSNSQLRALRAALGTGDLPLILAIHDYPDPDAIAAAMAMQVLAGSWGISSVIAHGGVLGREENAEMVRLLRVDLRTFASLGDLAEYRGAVFLDTQPTSRNHSLPNAVPVLAVIDHHSLGEDSARLAPTRTPATRTLSYRDVRSEVGASSTLLCGYLDAAGILPDSRLATALFLGVRTDTDNLLRDVRPADIAAYTRLLPLADHAIAAGVLHPPLEAEYFRFLRRAMEEAAIFGRSLMTVPGEVPTPDILSTASDALVRLRGIDYALAVGFHANRAYLSLRCTEPRTDATRVILRIVQGSGPGGGHGRSAGGSIDAGARPEETKAVIRNRFLEATGDSGHPGVPLL